MRGHFQHMVLATKSSSREEKRWGHLTAQTSLASCGGGGLPGPQPAWGEGVTGAVDSGCFTSWWV